jgi:hypothetical protein
MTDIIMLQNLTRRLKIPFTMTAFTSARTDKAARAAGTALSAFANWNSGAVGEIPLVRAELEKRSRLGESSWTLSTRTELTEGA